MKDDQRVALTKRLLKEGLIQLMQRKPLDKISVSELCAASGINRATFYRHYEIPQDILYDIEREIIEGIHLEDAQFQSMNEVQATLNQIFQYLYDRADIMRILLANRSDKELTRSINEVCVQIIEIQKKVRRKKDLDEDSIRLIAACSMGGIYFLLRQWLLEGIEKSPQELTELIMQVIRFYA